MRPGILLKELNPKPVKIIDHELVPSNSSGSMSSKNRIRASAPAGYFMHGVSHHLGYDA
jgi:hypothetical protein